MSEGVRPRLAFLAIGAGLLLAYLYLHFQYPFYFIWDMDHTTMNDLLLMQSGKHPVHVNHPGFGMYFVLKFYHWLGWKLGFVSFLNLEDLSEAVHPILGVAELTDYLRILSPFVALATAVLLWRTLLRSFELSWILQLLVLAAVGGQVAFFYHSTMIRTELYSVFFWAVALYCLRRSTDNIGHRASALWVMAGGLNLALSLFTKIQAAIYLAVALACWELFRSQKGNPASENPWIEGRLRWFGTLNFALVLFTLIAAAMKSPQGVTFTESYPINALGVGFGIAGFCCFVLSWWPCCPLSGWLGRARLQFAVALLTGFLAIFPLHFLSYSSPHAAYRYFLINAKMVFFRHMIDGAASGFLGHFSTLGDFISYNPLLFMAFAGAAVPVIFIRRRETWRAPWLAAVFFGLLAIFYGSRAILRDLLWAETALQWLCLWGLLALGAFAVRLRAVSWICLGLLLAGNLVSVRTIRRDLDALYNNYGWHWAKSFDGTYFDAHLLYAPAMHARYGKLQNPVWRQAFEDAENYTARRRAARFVFANAKLSLKQIGLLRPGFSPLLDALDLRALSVPEILSGAMSIDLHGVGLEKFRIREELVREPREALRKTEGTRGDELSILLRGDLRVFLLTDDPGPVGALPGFEQRRETMELASGSRRVTFSLFERTSSGGLLPGQLPGRFFWAVQGRGR